MMWGAWLAMLLACAEAEPPAPADPREVGFREGFAWYRSFVATTSQSRSDWPANFFSVHGGTPTGEGVLVRADHRGRFVVEGTAESGRIVWDGDHLSVHDVGTLPRLLGAQADALVRLAVDEARAGFPGTRLLPPAASAGLTGRAAREVPGALTWRLDFPGALDDPYDIHVRVRHDGTPEALVVALRAAGPDVPARLLASYRFDGWWWDVPVEDDFARRERWWEDALRWDLRQRAELHVAGERGGRPALHDERRRPYHRRYDRILPVFHPELSEGGPPPRPWPQPEAPFAEWEGVCEPGAVHTVPFRWVWRTDPTASDWQGVEAALAGGCPIRLHLNARRQVEVASGVGVRAEATLRVRSAEGDIAAVPAGAAGVGPLAGSGAIRFRVPLDGIDPWSLEIGLEGQLTVTCGPRSAPGVQRYALAAHDDESTPILRWNGCMPAPTPRTGGMELLPRRW